MADFNRAPHSTRIGEPALGHIRLGPLPKTKNWNQVVESITGSTLALSPLSSSASRVDIIAAETIKATKSTLARASYDAGVRYTFYLLTQVVLASRKPDWQSRLGQHGISLSQRSSVFDLTSEIQGAIDRYMSRTPRGATDVSEMAQQAAGEALTTLLSDEEAPRFEGFQSTDLRGLLRGLSTKRGFAQLGHKFFAQFVARFLNFHLSRVTAANLGTPRLPDLGYIPEFNRALTTHCEESARIVRDFCGDWYSKTEFEQGIDLSNSGRFLAIAVRKLKSELQHQERAS
jgi:hypothetical protein